MTTELWEAKLIVRDPSRPERGYFVHPIRVRASGDRTAYYQAVRAAGRLGFDVDETAERDVSVIG